MCCSLSLVKMFLCFFLPLYLLGSASDSPTEEDLIRKYFHDGYSNDEILDFLATTHSVKMSLRTLKSKLNSFSLSRQKNYSPLATVRIAIQEMLKGPGQHYGYRMMWQTLLQKYSLTVRRDDVMALTGELDPVGVQLRARRRFVKSLQLAWTEPCLACWRLWQIKTVWLGHYWLYRWLLSQSAVVGVWSKQQWPWSHCPKLSALCLRMWDRTDCGTENSTMVAIHCALRSSNTDGFAGAASHMYGSSTANQRIESWWSYFWKQRCGPQHLFLHP